VRAAGTLLVVACACATATQPEPLHNVAVSKTPLVAIENVRPLAIEKVAGAKHDCRLSSVVRRHFAGREVIACGPLAYDAGKPAIAGARECIEKALADGQPFLFEAQIQGIDSEVAGGLVGVVEQDGLATYELMFDSDPCGGSCPERGLTTISRCARVTRDVSNPEACAVNVMHCFRCGAPRIVEQCRFGG